MKFSSTLVAEILESAKEPWGKLPRLWWISYFTFLFLLVIPLLEAGKGNPFEKQISAWFYEKPQFRGEIARFLTAWGNNDNINVLGVTISMSLGSDLTIKQMTNLFHPGFLGAVLFQDQPPTFSIRKGLAMPHSRSHLRKPPIV